MTAPLAYGMEQAAARLGRPFTVDWLKGHIDEIPHLRLGAGRGRGGRVGFTEQHLAEIVAMFEKRPSAPVVSSGPVGRRRSA